MWAVFRPHPDPNPDLESYSLFTWEGQFATGWAQETLSPAPFSYLHHSTFEEIARYNLVCA